MSYITAEMRAAVGREIARFVSHPISEADIRKWLIAVYFPDEPPVHLIRQADCENRPVAPEEFNPFAWSVAEGTRSWHKIGSDPESYLGINRPQMRATLNGGIEVTYGVRMKAGDVITSVSRLGDYFEREGRLGRMLFSTTHDTWTNQEGELVKQVDLTLISYR
jgi:N-terminal half of MaoC dehydratase